MVLWPTNNDQQGMPMAVLPADDEPPAAGAAAEAAAAEVLNWGFDETTPKASLFFASDPDWGEMPGPPPTPEG